MRTKQDIVENWLPRYTKRALNDFTKYILLTNFQKYVEIFADHFNVPIVGTVTAGQPILAVENIESYFPIPMDYMPNQETFMLKVKGESMINAGIFNGDLILSCQYHTLLISRANCSNSCGEK
mgnify:CR=1 FL=1